MSTSTHAIDSLFIFSLKTHKKYSEINGIEQGVGTWSSAALGIQPQLHRSDKHLALLYLVCISTNGLAVPGNEKGTEQEAVF